MFPGSLARPHRNQKQERINFLYQFPTFTSCVGGAEVGKSLGTRLEQYDNLSPPPISKYNIIASYLGCPQPNLIQPWRVFQRLQDETWARKAWARDCNTVSACTWIFSFIRRQTFMSLSLITLSRLGRQALNTGSSLIWMWDTKWDHTSADVMERI